VKLKISIDPSTTNSELVHLGNFLAALGMNRGAHVISAPIDEAELDEPEPTCIPPNREEPVVHAEVPKRKRRTKAEIAAAAEAEERARNQPDSEAEERARNQPDSEAEERARNQPDSEAEAAAPTDPAPTPPVEPPATPPSETASTEPASASPSDRPVPTTGALNQKAAIVAKKHGPAMVKEKIISLGSTLISLLNDEGKIALDAWLDEQA
jgi:hypothetical protein